MKTNSLYVLYGQVCTWIWCMVHSCISLVPTYWNETRPPATWPHTVPDPLSSYMKTMEYILVERLKVTFLLRFWWEYYWLIPGYQQILFSPPLRYVGKGETLTPDCEFFSFLQPTFHWYQLFWFCGIAFSARHVEPCL